MPCPASFIMIDELFTHEQLFTGLMDGLDIATSRREEFLSEFQKMAARYRKPRSAPRRSVKATASAPKQKKNARPPADLSKINLPAGLKWPSRTYAEAAKKGVSILDHLEKEWKELIAAGIATRHVVETFDDTTLTGIENYLYGKSNKRPDKADRVIPAELLPLTKKQALDRAIMQDPTIVLTDMRVARTLGRRAARDSERKKVALDPLTPAPS